MTAFFQRLLPKRKRAATDVDTIPAKVMTDIETPPPTKIIPPAEAFSFQQLVAGCGQSTGLQRDHNEDALYMLTTSLASDTRNIMFGLYIVADGMGGHQHGEVASALAVRAMSSHIIQNIYVPLLAVTPQDQDQSIQEIMQEGVFQANQAILAHALGGGTTLTAILVFGDQLTFAHVGDSRAYLVREDSVEVITRDHSLVKRLEELGQITAEEAAIHPQRNVLYRALGQGEPFEPDLFTAPMPQGEHILLCSDGLWGLVPQEKILEYVNNSASPQLACQKLIEAANAAGGPDNISAVLVRLPVQT
jgi:serine/threonine protein phosphatase PrpC